MAANQVTFAPNTTTSPQNSFVLEAAGWIQGMELDNQPSRMQRESGLLINATQPVWGGMMVNQYIPNINQNGQGCNLEIATAQETDFGFVTFASAYNMILVPGNDVPSALNDGTLLYSPKGKRGFPCSARPRWRRRSKVVSCPRRCIGTSPRRPLPTPARPPSPALASMASTAIR